MKKRNLFIFLLAIVLVMALTFTLFACKDNTDPQSGEQSGSESQSGQQGGEQGGEQGGATTPVDDTEVDTSLSYPKNFKVSAGVAEWQRPFSGAKFDLEINGTVVSVGTAIKYDLTTYAGRPADGKFSLRVRTLKDGKASAWSAAISYTYVGKALLTPANTGLNGTNLVWDNSADASYPLVTVAGVEHKLAKGATSFDLSTITQPSDVSLLFAGDGVYRLDSEAIRLSYDPATNVLSFAKPTGVHMEGNVLHFDKVVGANTYYFCDVYNTVTYLTGEDINSLSNDREGHFLIQSMWAGSTDLDIANSAPQQVTYFATNEGTADSPYLISTVDEMRYIEYYEAIGQSNYYELATDVEFVPHDPVEGEDFSNFYNLGSFSGVLDGKGHSLKNIFVWYKDGYSSIFDNVTETGVIKNIVIEDTNWRTWTNRTNDGIMHEKGGECSILAYTNRGTIEGITLASGSIKADKDGAAGLVSINRGTIKGCRVLEDVTIWGANETGAIAIYNVGIIEDCINEGDVSGKATVGGIVGRNAGLVTKCGNEGNVSGHATVGGIVGYNYNIKDVDGSMQYATLVSYCYNHGQVTGMSFVGGIAGKNGSTGQNELDEVAYANAGIYGCYNNYDVFGTISAGGIVGNNSGYYTGAADAGFGVRGCYTSGVINVQEGFRANRIYLSVADCVWAENDETLIYVHYWKGADQGVTAWPGTKMNKVKVGDYDFYYVDVQGVSIGDISGLIFNRVNPKNTSGATQGDVVSVFNSTVDISPTIVDGSLIYAVNSDWTNATNACVGWLAGYNNMINDSKWNCPYTDKPTMPVVVSGNMPGVDEFTNSTDKQTIADDLNAVLDNHSAFVVVGDAYPVLWWEQ